ncbi:hypothetical protein MIN45_P0876 [Methylomarinovum tepidoasis]|uniref:Uncharacterized protein n=1 Tax=Methylomarinovum tepidoasis TaxID=2840183 RepID=A0AAU9CLJ8_9GAMM|nr:hypothetical protein [Methylomarinovum sp. IN45]BCX88507.1 hypothetical protein MIN45_P0876 [Methylomarinovum sp. IN45]
MADRRAENALKTLHEVVWYSLDFGHGAEYPAIRDDLAGMDMDEPQAERLRRLDELAIDYILTADLDDIWPGLLEDHPDRPIERWWWHLGAIRRGRYPIETLPEHLQRAIREASA